jgi:hypothetical protein
LWLSAANEERGTARRDPRYRRREDKRRWRARKRQRRDDGERWGSVGWTVERQGGEAFRIDGRNVTRKVKQTEQRRKI